MSPKERDELISRRMYYGIDKILCRFVETGCHNEENPNQNQNWCSCGKPFCYSCVAYQITRIFEPLIEQAKAEVAREAEGIFGTIEAMYPELRQVYWKSKGWQEFKSKYGGKK